MTASASSESSSSPDESGDSEAINEMEKNGEPKHNRRKKPDKGIFRNKPETMQSSKSNSACNTVENLGHENFDDCRIHTTDASTTRNACSFSRSPKFDENYIKIKRENLKTEVSKMEFNTLNRSIKSPTICTDSKTLEKLNYNGEIKNSSANIKREYDKIKLENGNDDVNKLMGGDDLITNIRKKRASSANCSPYKDKKRKKMFDEVAINQNLLPPTNHERIQTDILPPPPQKPLITKVYYSYFERTNDDRYEIREMK